MELVLEQFREDHIEPMTTIMTEAFNEDSMMHRGRKEGPAGYDDGSFLRNYAMNPDSDAYVVVGDGEPIGVVIVWENKENNENFLGCLFTKPDLHSKGIGTQIWKLIEETYPNTRIWRTDTPLISTRNMNFYINKCEFMAYHIENPMDREEASVHLIKFTEKWKG